MKFNSFEIFENISLKKFISDYFNETIRIFKPTGEILYSSDNTNRVLGYNSSAYKDNSRLIVIHPDDQLKASNTWVSVIEHPGESFTVQYRIQQSNGKYIWVESVCTLLTDLKTEPKVLMLTRNIDATKTLLDEISEKNFRLTKALQNLEENRLAALKEESKLLSAQMNPHFIFNLCNSLQNSVLSEDTDSTLIKISEFSNLIRSVLSNSELDLVHLESEIEFLSDYLTIESDRIGFEFSVNTDQITDLDSINVPPMFYQPIIENAIKHGILKSSDLESPFIELIFSENKDELLCEITNNRDSSATKACTKANHGKHSYRSSEIITKRINVLEHLYQGNFTVDTKHFNSEMKHECYTKVAVSVPKNLSLAAN